MSEQEYADLFKEINISIQKDYTQIKRSSSRFRCIFALVILPFCYPYLVPVTGPLAYFFFSALTRMFDQPPQPTTIELC